MIAGHGQLTHKFFIVSQMSHLALKITIEESSELLNDQIVVL
jgi:hypothetical protein